MIIDQQDEAQELVSMLRERDVRLARDSLLHLILAIKPDYQVNYHHFLMCERFTTLLEKPGQRIILTVPPQYGKSEVVSRFLPAWILGKRPEGKIIGASYASSLAQSFNRDCQRIMASDIYREIFPETIISPHQKRLKRTGEMVETSKGGYLYTVGVGGATTGKTANPLFIVDDPFKDLDEAMNPNTRKRVQDWYGAVAQTRISLDASIIIMHTRWHDDDLAGHLLKKAKTDPEATQWDLINFPALSDKIDDLHPEDPRGPNEALWPQMKGDAKHLDKIRRDVGSIIWNALYQQSPRIDGGNIIKSTWWRYYKTRPDDDEFEEMCISGDCAFKDLDSSDFVVLQVWGRIGSNKYLVDQLRDKMDIIRTIDMILILAIKYPKARAKLIEEAANGAAVIQLLKNKVSGLLPVNPKGSKISRVIASSPQIEAGNVWLPHESIAPFNISDYVDEFTSFPRGKNDDQVDATTQALDRLCRNEDNYLRKLLRRET